MRRQTRTLWAGALVAGGALVGLANDRAMAQTRQAIVPERQLLGVRLGRPFLEVFKKYGQPSEVQTVALSATPETLPSLGGGASGSAMGGDGGLGIPGMGGGAMGGGLMGGGMMGPGMMGGGGRPGMGGMPSPFGGAMPSRPGGMGGMGIPTAAPGGMGGGYPGMGGAGMMGPGLMGAGMGGPGMMGPGMGGPGMMGGGMGGAAGAGAGGNQPEYSSAFLLIYKRANSEARMEFLVNEDGRVAQISVAAPAAKTDIANKTISGALTSKRVRLGTPYQQVLSTYGTPERHRLLPGFRFMEAYFSKNYHAAFTFDTQEKLKCVRITIALAD